MLTRWVGGSKKGPKHAYVIYEWSLSNHVRFAHMIILLKSDLYMEEVQRLRD